MRVHFITYATVGTPYEDEAAEMAASLSQFGITAEIVGAPNLGDWCHNCAQKATVVRDAMLRYPSDAIVFTDADARFRQRPELFATIDCDFAAHYRNGEELLSGTLYFAPTLAAWNLVYDWQRRCAANPGRWDQVHLQDAVQSARELVVFRLPASYTAIFDDPKMCAPEDRVIEHTQASRRLAVVV